MVRMWAFLIRRDDMGRGMGELEEWRIGRWRIETGDCWWSSCFEWFRGRIEIKWTRRKLSDNLECSGK